MKFRSRNEIRLYFYMAALESGHVRRAVTRRKNSPRFVRVVIYIYTRKDTSRISEIPVGKSSCAFWTLFWKGGEGRVKKCIVMRVFRGLFCTIDKRFYCRVVSVAVCFLCPGIYACFAGSSFISVDAVVSLAAARLYSNVFGMYFVAAFVIMN